MDEATVDPYMCNQQPFNICEARQNFWDHSDPFWDLITQKKSYFQILWVIYFSLLSIFNNSNLSIFSRSHSDLFLLLDYLKKLYSQILWVIYFSLLSIFIDSDLSICSDHIPIFSWDLITQKNYILKLCK